MDTLFFHPKVVHIPMALAVLMPLISAGVLLAWWREWLPRQSWLIVIALQAILVGSGIFALRTGEAEEERVEEVVSKHLIHEHEEAAEIFVWFSGGVLGLALFGLFFQARKSSLPIAAAVTLGTLAVLGLGYRTGQAGGRLVYQYGAAQAYTNNKSGI